MELTARYGLEFNPFLKNSKEILFEGTEYTEAKFRLDYLARTKGFGLLTGAPGRGKTTLVRSWSAGLNPSLYKVTYTSLSTVTVNDFYRNLAASLGAQPSYRKTENFHIIQEEINRLLEQDDVPFAAQPIVCRDGSLYGYELLMRPETRNFKNIQEVLNLAKRQAKLPQFERLTWVGALRWLFTHKAEIPSDCHIFINSIANVSLDRRERPLAAVIWNSKWRPSAGPEARSR